MDQKLAIPLAQYYYYVGVASITQCALAIITNLTSRNIVVLADGAVLAMSTKAQLFLGEGTQVQSAHT